MRVLSLGAGVQSSTLLLMACEGEIEKPDCAIFADTGWEPKAVYEWLEWLEKRAAEAGIPVYRVTAGDLRADALNNIKGFASIPVYTRNKQGKPSQVKRQCTRDYKIRPIRRKVRELMETAGQTTVEQWMGISLDEATRMRTSDVKYITYRYPLIDRRMTRHDCTLWLERHGYPRPPKSSCVACPFHDDRWWHDLKANSPEEWADAVAFDEAIRRGKTRIDEDAFVHRSLKPLAEVDLSTPEDRGQASLWDAECTGHCGV